MSDRARTEKIITAIQKRIDIYQTLATDLIREYREQGEPIPKAIHQQYNSLGDVAEGLQEAINIIFHEGGG